MSKTRTVWLRTVLYVVMPAVVFIGCATSSLPVMVAGLAAGAIASLLLNPPDPAETTTEPGPDRGSGNDTR